MSSQFDTPTMKVESQKPRPPYDSSMLGIVDRLPFIPPAVEFKETLVDLLRQRSKIVRKTALQQIRADPNLDFEEKSVPGSDSPIKVEIVRQKGSQATCRPGIVFFHGGAMVSGDRFLGADMDWVRQLDAVVVAVEYHLAPESKNLVDDCFAAISWVGKHLEELSIDGSRLIVAGASAGAGLAASTALVSRDKGGPKLHAQMLICPMLDDRNDSVSAKQFWNSGTYTAMQNAFSWSCVLDDHSGGENVSYRVAAGRATAKDMQGLPEAYIDVGSAEPFRDEAVAYASKLWEAGTQAELHVWPGGPRKSPLIPSHELLKNLTCWNADGFELWAPEAEISKASKKARNSWLERIMQLPITDMKDDS